MAGSEDLLSFLTEGAEFPRGKVPNSGQAKRNSDSKQLSAINQDENIFKNNEPARDNKRVKNSRKRTNTTAKDGSADSVDGDDTAKAITSKKRKDSGESSSALTIPGLKFRSLVTGMVLLGAVKEINDLELLICLPNNLVGFVAITEISDEITAAVKKFAENDSDAEDGEENVDSSAALPDLGSMFSVGQLVCCAISDIKSDAATTDGQKKRIELSLRPELVNAGITLTDLQENVSLQGTIRSREDHGFTINIGIDGGVSAFLLKKDAKEDLLVGQPIRCLVKKAKPNSRIVPVALLSHSQFIAATAESNVPTTISALKPGMLVNVKVEKVLEDGLLVKFLGYFHGCVTWQHAIEEGQLLAKSFDSDLRNLFKPDQKLRARILYVYPENEDNMFVSGKNRIGLSLKPNITKWQPLQLPVYCSPGTVYHQAVVSRVQKDLGLYLAIANEQEQQQQFQTGFVHISRVSDSHTATLDGKHFKLGSIHPLRILSFDYMDGLLNATMQKSIIEMPFFSYGDVQVGQIISNAVVQKLDPVTNNLIVLLNESSGIRALCPPTHLADVSRLTQPEKRFKVGGKIKVRVLSVDAKAKRVTVTCKKTLLSTELPILSSVEELKKQQKLSDVPIWSHGVVSAVKPYGLIVGFFGGVKGLVHISQISEQRISTEDLAKHYSAGQIVKCRLIGISDEQDDTVSGSSRLKLSLRSGDSQSAGNRLISQFHVGQLVGPATVISMDSESIIVRLKASGDNESAVDAILPVLHLSDHPQNCADLQSAMKPGDLIKEVVVILAKTTGRPQLLVSVKPALLSIVKAGKSAAVSFPSDFQQLQRGMLFLGFVRRVDNIGVFVQAGGQLCGLAVKSQLSDTFVDTIGDKFVAGQTIIGLIQSLDHEKQQFSVCLKPSEVFAAAKASSETLDHMQNLASLYASQYFDQINSIQRASGCKPGFDVANCKIGNIVDMKVKSVMNFGVLLESNDGQVDGLITAEQMDSEKTYSAGEIVKALIIDADPVKAVLDLTAKVSFIGEKAAKKQKLQQGTNYPAKVLLVKQDYCVLKLETISRVYGFAMVKEFNDQSAPFKRFTPGKSVVVKYAGRSTHDDRNLFTFGASTNTGSESKQRVETSVTHTIANAIDPSIKSLEDFKVGLVTKGVVRTMKDNQMNVMLARGDPKAQPAAIPAVVGRIHVSEVFDSIEMAPKTKQNLFKSAGFKPGAVIDVRIIGSHDAKTHRWLPLTHLHSGKSVLELSVRPSELKSSAVSDQAERITSVDQLSIGTLTTCFVNEIITKSPKYALWASIGTAVRVHVPFLELSEDPKILADYENQFWPGKPVLCRITAIDADRSVVEASFLVGSKSPYLSVDSLQVGDLVVGKVVKKCADAFIIALSSGSAESQLYGRIGLTDISDDYDSLNLAIGQYIRVSVAGTNSAKSQIDLTTRPSIVSDASETSIVDRCIYSASHLSQGDLVRGFVKSVAETGLFVSIGRGVNARVKIAELCDDFVKEWKSLFAVGQLVKGRITAVDNGKIEMSLKQSLVDPEAFNALTANGRLTLSTLKAGKRISGTVVRVEPFGVFVELDNSFDERRKSALRGMCHRTELADDPVKSAADVYSSGDRVIALVRGVDLAKRQIQLCMKPSMLEGSSKSEEAEVEEMPIDNAVSSAESDTEMSEVDDSDNDSDEGAIEGVQDESDGIQGDEDAEMQDAESVRDDAFAGKHDSAKVPSALSVAFDWNVAWEPPVEDDLDNFDDDSSGEDSGEDVNDSEVAGKKRSKREKARLKREEEERIARRERQLASNEVITPENADDFDRALIASPNSSFLWIQYMAFYVNLVELDKARQIAERALKTINFREEKEKFNIWIAYLNLENKYGSTESVKKIFERSVCYNEPKHVYLALAKIYERTEKIEAAEELYDSILKKFKSSSKVWVQNGFYHFSRGELDRARSALQRSLQALPKRKHIKTIIKFAQFEFRFGDAERGRTIFEGIVANYPKRIDIWSVYIDMNIKTGEISVIRRLFERVLQLRLSSKKMKFFFKKYLDFEKKYGNEDSVQHVVQLARSYVESMCGKEEEGEE